MGDLVEFEDLQEKKVEKNVNRVYHGGLNAILNIINQSEVKEDFILNREIVKLEQKLAEDPDNVQLLEELANNVICLSSDTTERSESILNQIIRLDPTNAFAYANLGSIYQIKGDHQKAERCLLRARQFHPEKDYTHGTLAHFYIEQGEIDKAITIYKEALELSPNVVFSTNLADLYQKKKEYNSASAILEQVREKYHKKSCPDRLNDLNSFFLVEMVLIPLVQIYHNTDKTVELTDVLAELCKYQKGVDGFLKVNESFRKYISKSR